MAACGWWVWRVGTWQTTQGHGSHIKNIAVDPPSKVKLLKNFKKGWHYPTCVCKSFLWLQPEEWMMRVKGDSHRPVRRLLQWTTWEMLEAWIRVETWKMQSSRHLLKQLNGEGLMRKSRDKWWKVIPKKAGADLLSSLCKSVFRSKWLRVGFMVEESWEILMYPVTVTSLGLILSLS